MKYHELYNKYWEADEPEQQQILDGLDRPTRTAWGIVRMLERRKGFEYWWAEHAGGMDTECSDEIFDKMVEIIRSSTRTQRRESDERSLK
jgi:hypothetical protein